MRLYTINREILRYNIVFKRLYIILSLTVLFAAGARAQYDASFSHYWDLEPYFNPAAVGKQPKLNVVGAYAISMAGFENNPRTMYVGADMPFYFIGAYHGAGVSLLNDQIGLFTHQRIALQYAYKHKLFGGTISVGAQFGFVNEQFDGSKVDLGEAGDPAFATSDVNGNSMDLAAGLYYTHGRWYVGISAQHLTSPLVELGETNELQIDPTFYLTGGYNIKLRSPFVTIPTSVLVRTDGKAYRADVTARVVYTNDKKMMYAGVSYSPTNSVTAVIGGMFHGINLSYSYEMYTSALSIGNGSHELTVGYQTNLNLFKKGKNKHKSVRIL
ncbi:type IX secretion system membrane protein PorP/SprF [uncultured Prevotella sp.]|uniref:PorP/SprF family type IX secretion system membrane protein n=1 Tax=uncultured Prevotella sp. TaxID=159272 RepID=UPI0026137EE8|nr:type IX secretion system membrane protein PorP/SprF [uncultured Prevotella sp.]